MRLGDIDREFVLGVIEGLPQRFHTTDVSQNPQVRQRHAHLLNERNYNAVFGTFMSRLAHEAGAPIRFLSPGNGDAWWEKTGEQTASAEVTSVPAEATLETGRMVSVMTKVDRDTYDKLRLISFVRGQPLARLLRAALEDLVKDMNIPDSLMSQIREAASNAEADLGVEQDE